MAQIAPRVATLVLSLDYVQETPRVGAVHLACQWLECLHQYQLPATWFFAQPADAPLSGRLAKTPRQEIGLMGQTRWVSGDRRQQAQALLQLAGTAARRGCEIRSLAVAGDAQPDADLLAKYGITMIRAPRASTVAPELVERGVWSVGITHSLGNSSPWLFWRNTRKVLHALAQGPRHVPLIHLVVRPTETGLGRFQRMVLHRLFTAVTRHQQAGRLRVRNLQELGEELRRRHASSPSRSILRAA